MIKHFIFASLVLSVLNYRGISHIIEPSCLEYCRKIVFDIMDLEIGLSVAYNASGIVLFNSTVNKELVSTTILALSDDPYYNNRSHDTIKLFLKPMDQFQCNSLSSLIYKDKHTISIKIFSEQEILQAFYILSPSTTSSISKYSDTRFDGRNTTIKFFSHARESFHGKVDRSRPVDVLTSTCRPANVGLSRGLRNVVGEAPEASRSLQLQRNETSEVIVVGTLTTSASRLSSTSNALEKCLLNLLSLSLIHRVYLNIPWSYGLRTQTPNVTVPPHLQALVDQSKGRLRILRCDDYGPATKLLPLLQLSDSELPLDSILITFDDDRMYTPNGVASLVQHSLSKPDTAITIAAWNIGILSAGGIRGKRNGPTFHSHIRPNRVEGLQFRSEGYVDLVLGFYGVAYRKYFFANNQSELFDYSAHPNFAKHCAWVDDVWFSGHLERLGVPKFTIGNVADSRADITDLNNVGALSKDHGESVKQNHDNVLCAEAMREVWGIWGSQLPKQHGQTAKIRHNKQIFVP